MAITVLRDHDNDTPQAKAYSVGEFDDINEMNFTEKLQGKQKHINAFSNYLRALAQMNKSYRA